MASKGYIGAMRDRALASLRASSASLAALLDIAPPEKEQHYHDADYLYADRLRINAAFLESVVEALTASKDDTAFVPVEVEPDTETGDDEAEAEPKAAAKPTKRGK